MEKFDSDKRYHVAAIVSLIDIKKQTELFLITMSYLFVNYILQTKWFILQARFLY